jgi:hypothetical protein
MVAVSLLLAGVSLLVLFLGLAWTLRLGPHSYGCAERLFWHWMLGLGLLAPLACTSGAAGATAEVDFTSRRGVLKLLGRGRGRPCGLAGSRSPGGPQVGRMPPPLHRFALDGLFSGNRSRSHTAWPFRRRSIFPPGGWL